MTGSWYRRLVAVACVALVFPAGSGWSGQGQQEVRYDLRYKFQPGYELRWRVDRTNAVETTIQGHTERSRSQGRSIKLWTVTHSGAADRIMFLHAVEEADMWQQVGNRPEVRFNSRSDQAPPPEYASIKKDLGKVLTTITMDDRGRVLDRKDHRDLPQHVRESHGIVLPLPEEPVPVGHVWTVPREIDVRDSQGLPRRIHVRRRYTLQAVQNGVATIKIEFQVLSPLGDATLEANLIQEAGEGIAKFDIEAGRIVEQRLTLDKRIIGFQGPASVMHYVGRLEETFMGVSRPAASKPALVSKAPR